MSYKVYNNRLNLMGCTAKLKVGGTYMFEKDEADRIAAMEGATYDENKDCFVCNGERFYGTDVCSHQMKFFHVYPMGNVNDWVFEKKIEDSVERADLLKILKKHRDIIVKEIDQIKSKEKSNIILGEIRELISIARYFKFYEFCTYLYSDIEYVETLFL